MPTGSEPVMLTLRCRCGEVRGTLHDVAPRKVNRVVCYCDDCQAYARWLGGEGLMDAHGGTDICQISPAHLTIEDGEGQLSAVRLKPGGLIRWYAGCCRTPIANTMASGPPFAGVCAVAIDPGEDREPDEVMGPPLRVQAKFAVDGPVEGAYDRPPVRSLWRIVKLMMSWWWRGDGMRTPWPAREAAVLSSEERAALG